MDDACANAPMLEVRGFSKSYGRKKVIDDLSLEVMSGRIFGFVGPNGAGKSTLIRSIVGAQRFDGGQILIDGMSVTEHPVRCKAVVAYVPDNPDVYDYLTGGQYLSFMADMFGVGKAVRERRIRSYSDRLGLTGRLGELVSAYSHGMRQKLLVLDEPFVGLDPQAAFDLKQIMGELARSGSAIFFSSHVLEVVEKLCDEVAIIQNGAIVRAGATESVCGDESLESVFLSLAREGGEGRG